MRHLVANSYIAKARYMINFEKYDLVNRFEIETTFNLTAQYLPYDTVVCTENLIRIAEVQESLKLAE